MKQYELKYTDKFGREFTEVFQDMDEVRDYYRSKFSIEHTTVSFRSIKTGRIVE